MRRFEDCARWALEAGPAIVPSVMRRVPDFEAAADPLVCAVAESAQTADRRIQRTRHTGVDIRSSPSSGLVRIADLARHLHAVRLGYLPAGADRKSLWPESVTHVAGMNCYPCVRNTPKCPKCRFANARPEPDFRYFSKATASRSLENSMTTMRDHGRPVR